MKEQEELRQIEMMLQQEGYNCSLEPYSKAPPFGRLLVFLGNDHQDRERILEITTQIQELGEALSEQSYLRIQFELSLPFTVKPFMTNDVNSLFAFLNRMLELPGFELDEMNDLLFFRYVLLTSKEKVDALLLKGIIGLILMHVEIFSKPIEHVATGDNTFNDVLENVLEITETLGK